MSVVTITVIAYVRYIQVSCKKVPDFPWSWQAISYIWIYSLAWSSAPLLGWNRYTLELHGLDCALDPTLHVSSHVSFVLLFFLSFLVAPVSIMAFCYGYILYLIRMVSRICINLIPGINPTSLEITLQCPFKKILCKQKVNYFVPTQYIHP